jgi:Uma2 family endonuclease
MVLAAALLWGVDMEVIGDISPGPSRKERGRFVRRLEARGGGAHFVVMSTALKIPLRMTVAEFLSWEPPYEWNGRWQLRDAEPEMMAPASDRHGSIQSELAFLITAHLRVQKSQCRVVTEPGAVPGERSEDNCLVPDLGVTCAQPTDEHLMREPLVLIEILSPTNVSKTRLNVRAYRTIPTVVEIVVVHTSAMVAEVARRTPEGVWPEQPDVVDAASELRLDSIGFAAPLRDAYRTTNLA